MKVKIKKCDMNDNAWYKDVVGYVYEVSDKLVDCNGHICYSIVEKNKVTLKCLIVDDCQII